MKAASLCIATFFLLTASSPSRAQTLRPATKIPHHVLAFYYPWYGAPERHGHWVHWGRVDADKHDISDSTHYPVQGAYDSYDPALIDRQIELAKGHGITGFIASWWGPKTYEDGVFPLLLERALSKNFKVTVYWETAPGKDRAQSDRAVADLVYLLTRYGTNSAFLKVDGRPVIFVYGRVMGQVPLDSWPAIISEARARAGDFRLIADGYQEKYARLFDGVHEYNNCGSVKGKTPDQLRSWAAGHFGGAVALARRQSRIACVTVIPGYDDTKIRKPGLSVDRLDGQVYRVMWEEAIKSGPDWALITSWNEWHEGSEIEPSLEFGDKFLTLTSEFASRFHPTDR